MKLICNAISLIVILLPFASVDAASSKRSIGEAIVGGIANTATAVAAGISDTVDESIKTGKRKKDYKNVAESTTTTATTTDAPVTYTTTTDVPATTKSAETATVCVPLEFLLEMRKPHPPKDCQCERSKQEPIYVIAAAQPVLATEGTTTTGTTTTEAAPAPTTTRGTTTKRYPHCESQEICYSDSECNGGRCVGAFVGTCDCTACIDYLPCSNDYKCGGLIGGCDKRRGVCDCQQAHARFGFPKHVDTVLLFCNKKYCNGSSTAPCNGLPCHYGRCHC